MSENVRELIQQHHAFYEVIPYFVRFEARPYGSKPGTRMIQAGFDIDVYGIKASLELEPSPEHVPIYRVLQQAVATVLPHANNHCSIEVIPFPSTVILDNRTHLQPEDMLRIRVTHERGLDQACGASEESALKEIEKRLRDLGVNNGRRGA